MGFFTFIKTFWHKNKTKQDKTSVLHNLAEFKYKTIVEPRFADFDMMGHVNNVTYFTFMEIGRTKYWTQAIGWDWNKTGVIIGNASIDYIQPIFPEEPIHIYVRTSRLGTTSFDLEYVIAKIRDGKEIICSRGKTVCVAYDYTQRKPTPIPAIEREKMLAFEQINEREQATA